ncbi:hypothetical protein [Taibaiella koreensis]|uniref:hypothetical protein n=1 Tax=Taibaiella koreensis TaxID=1268548 RepID=UPI000E59D9F0|nr:hypothetical protein [Taibaiella koreensis]
MDKRILSPEELDRLHRFIISRSARFSQPPLLLEITDHFACKVEELLQQDSKLDLEAAMAQAHRSFGVKGFAPLAEAFEKSVYHRYKTWYRREQKQFLLSLHLPGMILLGALAGKLFLAMAHRHLLQNGMGILCSAELLYGVAILILRQRAKTGGLLIEKAHEASVSTIFWLWVGLAVILAAGFLSPQAQAWLTGMITALLGANLVLFARLMKKAATDTAELKQQMNALNVTPYIH